MTATPSPVDNQAYVPAAPGTEAICIGFLTGLPPRHKPTRADLYVERCPIIAWWIQRIVHSTYDYRFTTRAVFAQESDDHIMAVMLMSKGVYCLDSLGYAGVTLPTLEDAISKALEEAQSTWTSQQKSA